MVVCNMDDLQLYHFNKDASMLRYGGWPCWYAPGKADMWGVGVSQTTESGHSLVHMGARSPVWWCHNPSFFSPKLAWWARFLAMWGAVGVSWRQLASAGVSWGLVECLGRKGV